MHDMATRGTKADRQRRLLRLVKRAPATTQTALVADLRREGFAATQASISRDLRELGVVKLGGKYLPAERVNAGPLKAARVEQPELITSVEPVGGNLVIVRTQVGAASRVAAQIDAQPSPGIAATLAGDDTIFIAVRSRAAQGRVLYRLRRPASA